MRPDDLEPMSDAMKGLLDAERPLDAVPAATRAKVFAKVSASMVGGGITAAAGGKIAAASGKAALTTKVVIAAVAFSVGGGVGAGTHAVLAKRAPPPAPIVLRIEAPPVAP